MRYLTTGTQTRTLASSIHHPHRRQLTHQFRGVPRTSIRIPNLAQIHCGTVSRGFQTAQVLRGYCSGTYGIAVHSDKICHYAHVVSIAITTTTS